MISETKGEKQSKLPYWDLSEIQTLLALRFILFSFFQLIQIKIGNIDEREKEFRFLLPWLVKAWLGFNIDGGGESEDVLWKHGSVSSAARMVRCVALLCGPASLFFGSSGFNGPAVFFGPNLLFLPLISFQPH
jgi:hypothetical protein